MTLTLEKAKHLKAAMLDPSLPQLGLNGREMLDLLTLATNGLEAMHAGASDGNCPDCSIDDVPCPNCYEIAWRKKHPAVMMLSEQAVRLRVPPVDIPNVD